VEERRRDSGGKVFPSFLLLREVRLLVVALEEMLFLRGR